MISPVSTSETQERSEPVRRCLVCRREASKAELLRFVVVDTKVFFDVRQRMPGRGMQVCASLSCLERAAKGAFKRGAKSNDIELPEGSQWIAETIVPALSRLYEEVVSSGRISGQLIVSTEAVTKAAKENMLAAYLLATDASQGTLEKIEANARRKGLRVDGLLDRHALSRLVGRENTVLTGWKAGKLHDRFAVLESQLRALNGPRSSESIGFGESQQLDS